jgi:hypothetical protein
MEMHNLIVRLGLILTACTLVLTTAACGDDHGHENNDHGHENNNHEEESPADHACEHAQDGPFVPESGSLQAAADASGDLPVIHDAEWTTIQLADEDADGTYEGFVTFEAKEAVDHRFFTSVTWPGEDAETASDPYIVITNADGGADPTFETKHPVGEEPGCPEVNFNHFYHDFTADTPYTVEISGHPEEMITIVAVPEGAGDHEEH